MRCMGLPETFQIIRACIVAIGSRLTQTLETEKPISPTIVGTGFIVDKRGIVARNRHVADALAALPRHPKTGASCALAILGDNAAFFKGRELYLVGNQSRGRGIGFLEAGNFYPDFIVWLLLAQRQYITFTDPKGIRNLQGANDPKIRFHETIKGLEQRLGDPKMTLNSFVVSVTPYKQVGWWEARIMVMRGTRARE